MRAASTLVSTLVLAHNHKTYNRLWSAFQFLIDRLISFIGIFSSAALRASAGISASGANRSAMICDIVSRGSNSFPVSAKCRRFSSAE